MDGLSLLQLRRSAMGRIWDTIRACQRWIRVVVSGVLNRHIGRNWKGKGRLGISHIGLKCSLNITHMNSSRHQKTSRRS